MLKKIYLWGLPVVMFLTGMYLLYCGVDKQNIMLVFSGWGSILVSSELLTLLLKQK